MPQSLVKNYMHISFSTKNRHPFIDSTIKDQLFSYLGGISKSLECNPIIVGGHKEHVHILCMLSRKIALMKLIEELKTHSSKCLPDRMGRDKNKGATISEVLLVPPRREIWRIFDSPFTNRCNKKLHIDTRGTS